MFYHLIIDFIKLLIENIVRLLISITTCFISPFIYIYNIFYSKSRKTYNTILITGGNSGLGESLAVEYSKPNITLILLARDCKKLKNVKLRCEERGAIVYTYSISVTNKNEMKDLLLSIDDNHAIDCIIANAGVTAETLGSTCMEEAIYDVFDINIYGVLNTIVPLLDRMRLRKYGQIVIMSSLASYVYLPSFVEYATSKAAVRILGQGLRPILELDNIGCTVICPGFVKTAMTAGRSPKLFFIEDPNEAARWMIDAIERNVAVYSFPFSMHLLTLITYWFPTIITDKLISLNSTISKSSLKSLKSKSN